MMVKHRKKGSEAWAAFVQKHRWFFTAAIVAFPTLTNLVGHMGSTFLALLTLAGLPLLFCSNDRPALSKHEKWVMWAFCAYFGVYLLSFAFNALTGTLADPRSRDLDHEFRFVTVVPIFFLLRAIRIRQNALWGGVIAGALLCGLYALVSYFWLAPGERVSGSYHAIAFGGLSLTLAFLSIPAMDCLKERPKASLLILLVAFLLAITASFLSGTRGAWIAIPALTALLFFYVGPRMRLIPRLIMVAVGVTCLTGAYLAPATGIAKRIDVVAVEVKNYLGGDRTYSSVGSRLDGWVVAIDIFTDHPVLGAGPGNYEPMMQHKIEQGMPYQIAAVHSQPHSAYPSSLADTGLVGFFALLGLFLAPALSAFSMIRHQRPARHLGYALLVLVAAFMHFGLTETIFSLNINLTFYIIIAAVILAVAANERESEAAAQ